MARKPNKFKPRVHSELQPQGTSDNQVELPAKRRRPAPPPLLSTAAQAQPSAAPGSNWAALRHTLHKKLGNVPRVRKAPHHEHTLQPMLPPLGSSQEATKVIALDCEMVGVGDGGERSALAR
jgi:hypothetical protein